MPLYFQSILRRKWILYKKQELNVWNCLHGTCPWQLPIISTCHHMDRLDR